MSVEDDARASSLVRIAAELPRSGTVADMRVFVSRTLGVPAGSLIFADVYVGKYVQAVVCLTARTALPVMCD